MKVVANPEYARYLNGSEWAEKRQQRIKRDGHKCYRCSATEGLEVHHVTYERLGRERLTDLLTLCGDCHKRDHGRDPSLPEAFQGQSEHMRERSALESRQGALLEQVADELGISDEVVDEHFASRRKRGLLVWRGT